MSKALIIGGTSTIATGLFDLIKNQYSEVGVTNRKAKKGNIFLDLHDGKFSQALRFNAAKIFFCAAMTSIKDCETNQFIAYKTNVSQTLELINLLADSGAFIIWLSSNTVFDGLSCIAHEDSAYSPTTIYGRLKMEVEKKIIESPTLTSKVAIVRLTKVISSKSGIASNFIKLLQSGKSVDAFDDLYFSPISLAYVCDALQKIAIASLPGIYHLSGESEITYLQFAQMLADRLGVSRKFVCSIKLKTKQDTEVNYRPKHPSLNMIKTTQLLGLHPEKIELTLNELLKFN